MSLTAQQLQQRLIERFQPTLLQVIDESAAHAGHLDAGADPQGTHFRVQITSEEFTLLSRVNCHRLVYDALNDFFAQGLHALAIEIIKPTAKENS